MFYNISCLLFFLLMKATKPHYENMEEGGRNEDEEGFVYLREPIWIHAVVIDYGSN